MDAKDILFAGAIPELYDRYLVPLIFKTYAEDLAGRIAGDHPLRLLELAAGTGALTRELATRLPAEAVIVATDLNQPMLDRAALRQGEDARISFRQADALTLPFADRSFDAVACQFGVMFFPDKVKAYGEARRVLVPGGHYRFNAWGPIDANVFAETVTAALGGMFPDDPPLFMARTPHGYYDKDRIRSEVEAAGFRDVVIETVDRVSRGSSAMEVATTYCQGTPMRGEIEARRPEGLAEATERAALWLERRFGTGPIEGPIQALVVDAVA